MREALLGFKRQIPHLDGHKVDLDHRLTTNPGMIEKIKGEGMPKYEVSSEHGDLLVTYDVDFPKTLSSDQISKLKVAFAMK